MVQSTNENANTDPNELSLKDMVFKFKAQYSYLKLKWKKILILTIAGAIAGLLLAIFIKPTYKATTTFVLEDSKGDGLSQYAGLASLAGINLGNEGGGVFQGDNILQLYTSRTMIEQTLLTKAKFNNKESLLIDRYIAFNDLRDKWGNKPKLANITFNGDPAHFSREQDSIITDLTTGINNKNLYVTRDDKKTSIIQVDFDSKDELFAMVFSEKLVDNVNNFYVKTKTQKAAANLEVLQRQADSVKRLLNLSIFGVASLTDAAPNANPNMQTLRVPSQRKQVDLQANAAVYTEMIKNAEIAKISLMQAKPLIQIIDQPVLPLNKSHLGKILGIILGGGLVFVLTIISILVAKFFKTALN